MGQECSWWIGVYYILGILLMGSMQVMTGVLVDISGGVVRLASVQPPLPAVCHGLGPTQSPSFIPDTLKAGHVFWQKSPWSVEGCLSLTAVAWLAVQGGRLSGPQVLGTVAMFCAGRWLLSGAPQGPPAAGRGAWGCGCDCTVFVDSFPGEN